MDDRRRFPRYNSALRVRYATNGIASVTSNTLSRNISRVGIRIPVSRLIRKGDEISLNIYKDDIGPIQARGKVRWTKTLEPAAPLMVDAGIEFTKIESSELDHLLHELQAE